jgi:hypothetical protein
MYEYKELEELRAKIDEALQRSKERIQKSGALYEDLKGLKSNWEAAVKQRAQGSYWTRTKTFKRLCTWAFKMCDNTKTGRLTKPELYSGLLLVYINLAKYAGPAACHPPSREVVDMLFDACDFDNSGDICEKEFVTIMIILSSQLTWRIFTFYTLMILLVPYVIMWTVNMLSFIGVEDTFLRMDRLIENYGPFPLNRAVVLVPDSVWEKLPKSLVSFGIFSFVIPYCWDTMDAHFQTVAETNATKQEGGDSDGGTVTSSDSSVSTNGSDQKEEKLD